MPTLIDISPLLSPRLGVWPGDAPFRMEHPLRMSEGGAVNLSTLSFTAHVGAHADAPLHVVEGGLDIASLPLETFYGPCQVIEVDLEEGARIEPWHLPEILAPRVLFKTRRQPALEAFSSAFHTLTLGAAQTLSRCNCILLGIDAPSLDPFGGSLEVHHAILGNGIAVLENLELSHVEPGIYTLIALPLRIEGGDGSPVRAILVK